MPLPVALLCLAVLHGLPAFACWLAMRRRQRNAAIVVGLLALTASGYVAIVQWPTPVPDFIFWLLVGGLPLFGSAAAIVAALRLRTTHAKNA